MPVGTGYDRLAIALRGDYDALVSRWVSAYESSMIRMPGTVPAGHITQLASPILECLVELVSPPQGQAELDVPTVLTPGAAHLREVEKSVAFIGGTLSSTDAQAFDVAAIVLALRDVLVDYTEGEARHELFIFFEWLAVLAVDSFSATQRRALGDKARDQLESGTPVFLAHAEIPAAMLVCDPDTTVLNAVFSRLLLLCVRVGARAVIIDGSGLVEANTIAVRKSLDRLLAHRKLRGQVEVFAVGLDSASEKAWADVAATAGATLRLEQHFEQALTRALEVSGFRFSKLL